MMTNTNTVKKHVDIKEIIAQGDSRVLKSLPGLVIHLIKRVVREKEINRVLGKYSGAMGVDFLRAMVREFNLRLHIEGEENLPDYGRCFFVSNHPFGVIDGLVLTLLVSEKYGTLKAIGNEAFMFLPNLRPLIAAVNVYGQSSKSYVKALDEVFHSEVPITHFPAGEVSRKSEHRVQDTAWKKSFITKAIETKRDVVPFHFFGRNSFLFYATHSIRKFLGIPLNIELMLLPREMFRKRNKTIRVRIGKPIPYQSFDESRTHVAWAQEVRSMVYELGRNRTGIE